MLAAWSEGRCAVKTTPLCLVLTAIILPLASLEIGPPNAIINQAQVSNGQQAVTVPATTIVNGLETHLPLCNGIDRL
jgi:hypothetical protein